MLKYHPAKKTWTGKTLRTKGGRRANRLNIQLVYGDPDSRGEDPDNFRLTILYHRLIWMIAHERIIPDDCEIHHIDGDRYNNSVFNLTLMSTEAHRALHYPEEDTRESFT